MATLNKGNAYLFACIIELAVLSSVRASLWYGSVGHESVISCACEPITECHWQIVSGRVNQTPFILPVSSLSVDGEEAFGRPLNQHKPSDLLIRMTQSEDAGTYECHHSDSMIESYELTLYDVILPENIRFNGELYSNGSWIEQNITAGEPQELICHVESARPPPNIRWVINQIEDVTQYSTTVSEQIGTTDYYQSNSMAHLSFDKTDESVACVVSHNTLSEPHSVTVYIDVNTAAVPAVSAWSLLLSLIILTSSCNY